MHSPTTHCVVNEQEPTFHDCGFHATMCWSDQLKEVRLDTDIQHTWDDKQKQTECEELRSESTYSPTLFPCLYDEL